MAANNSRFVARHPLGPSRKRRDKAQAVSMRNRQPPPVTLPRLRFLEDAAPDNATGDNAHKRREY